MPCFILATSLAGLTLAHKGRRPRLHAPRVTTAEGTKLTLALNKSQMQPFLCTRVDGASPS